MSLTIYFWQDPDLAGSTEYILVFETGCVTTETCVWERERFERDDIGQAMGGKAVNQDGSCLCVCVCFTWPRLSQCVLSLQSSLAVT